MDHQASAGLDRFQLVDELLSFPADRSSLRPACPTILQTLFLQAANQLIAVLHGRFLHLRALQDCTVGIRLRHKAACPLEQSAQLLAFLQSVASGMEDLSRHMDGAANVAPSTDLG